MGIEDQIKDTEGRLRSGQWEIEKTRYQEDELRRRLYSLEESQRRSPQQAKYLESQKSSLTHQINKIREKRIHLSRRSEEFRKRLSSLERIRTETRARRGEGPRGFPHYFRR